MEKGLSMASIKYYAPTLGDRLWHLLVLIRNGEKTLFEVMTRISQLDNIHATLPSPMVYKDPLSLEEFDNL